MAMNNSDFLSDAVAIDLGKSGVKVAETLEIEVGEEWWRLINASDVSTVRAYQGRSYPLPVLDGEEMHLGGLTTKFSPASGQTYNVPASTIQPFMGVAFVLSGTGEMSPRYFSVYYERSTNNYFIAHIYDDSGNRIHTISPVDNYSGYTLYGAYWDHTNQRIMATYQPPTSNPKYPSSYARVVFAGITDATFSYGGETSSVNLHLYGFTQPKVFPEQPGSIYTLFKEDGALSVKRTDPTLGQSPVSVNASVCLKTGATTISVAANYSYSTREADLFFSRKHQSVGVAWVDKTTRFMYYALESEGWANIYLISQKTAEPNIYMTSFGNLVLPGSLEEGGEYYLAGLREQDNGVIGLPIGYSFPANFNVLSVCPGTEEEMRLIGSVGANLYMYSVRYSDMTIIKTPSSPVSLSFTPEIASEPDSPVYSLTKVAGSGSREIFFFQVQGKERTRRDSRGAVLLCYDTGTGEIIWKWESWESSSLFPVTYRQSDSYWFDWRSQTLQRMGPYVLVMQAKTQNSDVAMEYYWLQISALLACETDSDVTALCTGRKYQTLGSLNPDVYDAASLRVPAHQNACITWGIVNNLYCFVLAQNRYGTGIVIFYVNPGTMTISRVTKEFRVSATNYYQVIGASIFVPEERRYELNLDGDDTNSDSYVRCTRNVYHCAFVDSNNTHVATIDAISGGIPWIVSLNTPDVAYFPSAAGSTIYLTGGTISNCSTQRQISLGHTYYKMMVSEFDDKVIFLGKVSGGNIPYTKIGCFEADYKKGLIVDANDFTNVYQLDKGFTAVGGVHSLLCYGSYLLYRDGTARMWATQTGALLTEFLGGGSGGTDGASIVYAYLTREFIPYPFAREGIRAELSNISKTTKITLPETQDNLIRGMLAAGTDFRGSRCILRRVFPDHIDEPGADIVLLDGYIQDWSYVPGKKGIAFSVSKTLIDVGAQFPKRLMNMGCSHVFKGSRCRYLGEEGRCLKTRAFCSSIGNLNQFGGFPWVAARQRRVMWK